MKYPIIVFALLGSLLFIPSTSFAEDSPPLNMEELTVQVLPEFASHPLDQKREHPPLLIGFQGTLMNRSSQALQGEIKIPIPIKEKNFRIGYVADYSSDLKAHEITYEIDRKTGIISWKTSTEIQPNELYKFVIEYYTDALTVNKDARKLDYSFKSFADIGLVNITIAEPLEAEKMQLTPKQDETQTNSYGQKMRMYHFQDVKAGDQKNFEVSYRRSETKVTSELIQQKGKPEAKQTAQKFTSGSLLSSISVVGIMALAAVLLIVKMNRRNRKLH